MVQRSALLTTRIPDVHAQVRLISWSEMSIIFPSDALNE